MRKFWMLSVLVALLSGCAKIPGMSSVGDFFVSKQTVTVTELGRSAHCNAQTADPHLELFPHGDALKSWATKHGVDFYYEKLPGSGWLAVVGTGQRSTAGHALAVSRQAQLQGAHLTLRATFIAPREGQMAAQVLTSPCVLVALPDADIRVVELQDQTGQVRATWHQ